MALSSRLKLWEQKIKEEKKPPSLPVQPPPPPLSAVPGGFLKQLVRETEKETRLKEPEAKEERAPSKLSNDLVQQFLHPDETPSILEAEMALRAEQLVNGERGRLVADRKDPSRAETYPNPRVCPEGMKEQHEKEETKEAEKVRGGKTDERQEPEGRLADSDTTEHERMPRADPQKDVWFEAGKVWFVHKDGFTLAMQLKPDEGTPELPNGRVRVRLETDGSVHDVTEYEVEKVNPSELDLLEDLSNLQSVNEPSVLHVLSSRARAQLPLTRAGPGVLVLWPPSSPQSKGPRGRRSDGPWEAPSVLQALARRTYVSMVRQRRDQSVVALGRSGTGKTTACVSFMQELLKQAGTAGSSVTAEKLQSVFTVLRSFGCVSSQHSEASSRVAALLSIDFNHAGLAAGGQLQTMLLEKWRVCQRQEGESNFLVFSQMLAGLNAEMRTELHLHQLSESNSFGIVTPTKVEERQKASAAFTKLVAAMESLDFSANEQRAIWHVLAGIYHLGAAGACKVGRRQFVNFDSAQLASSVIGCEGEELQTAVFKHHLRQLLQKATGGSRGRHIPEGTEESGPRLSASQCVEGMAIGLYEELFSTVVSLINRSLCSQQLTLASVMVVDAPGLRNPRHGGEERAAGFAELCHNYLQERLLEYRYNHTFTHTLEQYVQEKVPVDFAAPESSPAQVVSAIDQPVLQLRAAEDDPRGLLWVLDEEMITSGSTEANILQRACQYFSEAVRQCEQPLQCEIAHQLGTDPIRYDVSGWFGMVQNNPSVLSAASLLQNSSIGVVKSLFGPRASVPPLCQGLGGVEGGSQRSLQRSGTVRKTLSGGLAAIRRHSSSVSVKLQADALINLIRRASPTFLQCFSAKTDGGGGLDVPPLRSQLTSAGVLPALQLHRTGYPDHMSLSDFRCRFQALSPPVMKRYGSVFITPDEKKAVGELLIDLDMDRKSITVGTSRVFMKRGVMLSLEQQRDQLVSGWLVLLQASCMGHQARQKYRCMKVQQMAIRCVQRNLRASSTVHNWSWWKLLCRVRPLLDINIDDQRFRAKEDEMSALRCRLEKSEKERNELRQSSDNLETKVTALSSELSDERFRGDAVSQALDMERAERLRLCKENKELQGRLDQCKVTIDRLEKQLEEEKQQAKSEEALRGGGAAESELLLQLECAQTEVEFLRRRLRQAEERQEAEREARAQLESKVSELQTQLEQSKRNLTELKRQCRRVTSDLLDAHVLTEALQGRAHEMDRKQRRFDSELTQALGGADTEREQKEKAIQENIALSAEILSLQRHLKEVQTEVSVLRQQKDELCAQIRDATVSSNLSSDSIPGLKKQLRELEVQEKKQGEEISKLTANIQWHEQMHLRCEMEMERMKQIHQKELEDKEEELEDVQKSSQRRLRQLEMQLEQEYEEKQMVLHEKHDLEGLIATLCEQVGHRDFDVEKRLRRDLKRTHALLSDAQLLLSTVDTPGQGAASREQLEHLKIQLEESETRRVEAESMQKTLSMELENAQLELETICKHKDLVDEQLSHLQHENADLLKRVEEDQEDLNELMKKHKALIAQSSSDISQIRELQAELEEARREKQRLQDELQQSVTRQQNLEASTVARSIVSLQEARVCDLENKLEYQRGQIKRFEVLVLRLRDSVVRLGEELEQAAQTEARERENAHYYQQRLADMRLEMEELSLREQDSSRRCMELELHLEEVSSAQQALQAELQTSARRVAQLQAALEEVESSDESDGESVQTAVQATARKKDLDAASSVGSLGTEDAGEGIRTWLGVPRGRAASPYGGSSTTSSLGGRMSVTDTMSTYSFRSFASEREVDQTSTGQGGRASSSSALSELLEGLRKKRGGWQRTADPGEDSTVSLPIYQTTGASALRRRSSALSLQDEDDAEGPRPGILKPTSPLVPRASSLRSLSDEVTGTASGKLSRFGSCESLASSVTSAAALSRRRSNPSIPEEEEERCAQAPPAARSPQLIHRRILGSLAASEAGELELGAEPLVFQNRRLLGHLEKEEQLDDTAADGASDILPAIRRARSVSSLSGASSVRGGGRRTLSVHFGELPPSRTASRRGSDSDDSGSGGCQRQGERLEAEGSEGDVNAVMKKYLRKAEAD
ncbi:LOW QUALITY PROTEIN: unconventional myosin-XVIIIb-like [Brienomyrus brachyistius]|uniref:LOW QUALITY PROTEIN: unconventional myosin-XVIIIb-like n=1 Tax=Brienomyrus brachyistius TaxID=42636 RepID=UPI0020B3BF73|nr:LOW QUALITY PROTEIN: unconventional myosin-XVIIIb-like [Brienomyrus brachyistius]